MNLSEKAKDWTERSKQFYLDTRSEMKKVSWPARQEIVGTTIVVVATVFFFGVYLGLVDYLLTEGLGKVLSVFGGG
jgi:preprotein translocase subunit SecE